MISGRTIINLHRIFKMEMIRNSIVFILLVLVAVSCDKPAFKKPEHLVGEDKMIEMMVDIHLAEATFNNLRARDSLVRKSSSADFYYSVLNKYQVPDSVFEKSFVYYASYPKKFEKMYRNVMNKLSIMDQEYSGRQNDELDLGQERRKSK